MSSPQHDQDEDSEATYAAYDRLFQGLSQMGPADPATTRDILATLAPHLPDGAVVADMGCGVGAATLRLAEALPEARIVAVDLSPRFLDIVQERARQAGVAPRIEPRAGSMIEAEGHGLAPGSVDLLWAESSIYAVGRDRALAAWKPLLKAGGWLVFSDIVWHVPQPERPPAAVGFWAQEYPAMGDPAAVDATVREHGLSIERRIRLPRRGWSAYYDPVRARIEDLRHEARSRPALATVCAVMAAEIALFDAHGDSFASMTWVTRRRP